MGSVGMLCFLSNMVTPATVTKAYNMAPRKFMPALCCRGALVSEATSGGVFLKMRLRGFTIMDIPVTAVEVSKFVSFAMIGISSYIALQTNSENSLGDGANDELLGST